jgi:acetolactate synthase-1/2/3 large subunit
LRHGIDTIFGLPGVQIYGLFDAIARNSNHLRLIHARHEQTTAYMALGYACASGRPAAYAVVPGPGVLNTAAALATAWGLNAPVLCLTGQVPSPLLGRERRQLHELKDQLATLRSLVKWAERIEHPAAAPDLVARAFQEMRSGRGGPAALEMPWDQFAATAELTLAAPLAPVPAPVIGDDDVAAIARLVAAARAPMIWVGGGAQHASAEIRALAARLAAPVASFRTGRGIVDDRHPLGISVAAAQRLFPDTDLLLAIGTRLEVATLRWGGLRAGGKIVRIDIDPAEMRRLKVNVFVTADAAAAAARLAASLPPRHGPEWLAAVARAKAQAAEAVKALEPQISFLGAIRDVLPEHGILCDEMTQTGYVSWFGYPTYRPRTLITSGMSGTLGAGFPMALGVKVARPDAPVVALTGDGGFLFAGTELATAVQHNIGVITVLFNNSAYGNVLRDQQRLYQGRVAGAVLRNPDFQGLARSFGVAAWKTDTAAGLRAALTEALATDAPALIEVATDIGAEASPWEFIAPSRR